MGIKDRLIDENEIDWMPVMNKESKTRDADDLLLVMYRMGFGDEWIKIMIMCVKSISFFILISEEPKGLIEASKGLTR